jgi:LacI family transcriptional regulator
MAMSVYSAVNSMGLKIPDDISVIGYDNQIVVSEFLIPQLTTIELPHYELGERAVEFLFHHKYPFKPRKTKLQPKLVIRNSVKQLG